MSATLFDALDRDDARPARFNEPTFRFLNSRVGTKWQCVRDLLDEWFSRVPSDARADLRSRLQSGASVDFRSAFLELYCHEVLRRAGWDLEFHPPLEHTSRHPDLRASRRDVTVFVEVTTTSQPRLNEASEARLNTVMGAINDRMEIDRFMLGVDVLSVGNDAPATGALRGELQAWLSSLNTDQLINADSDGADYSFESVEWIRDGWHLTFEAYPLPADRRGPGGRIIGTLRPGEAHIIDDVTPLRRRMAAKAKAYGKLNAPFVIAVDTVSESTEEGDFVSALYGTSAVRYYQNGGRDALPPTAIRLFDGFWAGRHCWQQTQVSAVLASTRIMPWTIGSTVPTLWHHPGADLPVDGICPLLRQARLDLTSRQIQYSEPNVGPQEFFGLPHGWPERG